jgi:hypothetical protein
MSDLRIEKARFPVTVTLMSGARVAGEMFVQSHSRHHPGAEEPRDVLNDAEPFFPLATSWGETLLIAKEQVRDVEAEGTYVADHIAREGLLAAVVEVNLVDGEMLCGSVLLETSSGRTRLLDSLNIFGDRFLALYMTSGARLINRRLIQYVRPLD